jgi:hypothetical protein
MTQTNITLYGDQSEAFEQVKEQIGPEGVDPNNTDVVMRLIEVYERHDTRGVSGGLQR